MQMQVCWAHGPNRRQVSMIYKTLFNVLSTYTHYSKNIIITFVVLIKQRHTQANELQKNLVSYLWEG